MYNKQVLNA